MKNCPSHNTDLPTAVNTLALVAIGLLDVFWKKMARSPRVTKGTQRPTGAECAAEVEWLAEPDIRLEQLYKHKPQSGLPWSESEGSELTKSCC